MTLISATKLFVASAVMFCFSAPFADAQWTGYRAPGVPRTPDGKVNLTAPVPKSFDGHPDLGGTWESEYGYFADLGKDLKPGDIVMTQWAKDLQTQRESSEHNADRMTQCMPPGVPRMNLSTSRDMVHPFKIVQAPSLVMLLYETSANSTFRQVFMDGRPFPKNPNPTWLGYSIGHWEGNTLVVETTGFNGEAWVDTVKGHPQSDQGRVIERFTRRDYGHLEIAITIDDPKAYVKPWTAKVPAHLMADSDLIETYCENEKDSPHMSLGGVH